MFVNCAVRATLAACSSGGISAGRNREENHDGFGHRLVCVAATGDARGRRAARAQLAPATFEISSAHHYDLTGDYRFSTDFYNMRSFNAPNGTQTNTTGHFVFQEQQAGAEGGYFQIRFPRVFAVMRFRCAVSAPAFAFRVNVGTVGARQQAYVLNASSGMSGGQAYFDFETRPMLDPGEMTLRIGPSGALPEWALDACTVTAAP